MIRGSIAAIAIAAAWASVALATAPDYEREIAPIFAKYCAGCHNNTDTEGDLSLASFATLSNGGSRGPLLVVGKSGESLLIQVLTGKGEPAMPPEDSEAPSAEEIATLIRWIDSGASGPTAAVDQLPELTTPQINAVPNARDVIASLAISPDGDRIALARYERVELVDATTNQKAAQTPKLPGKVNSVSFSGDGSKLVAASGLAGLYGVATICSASDGSIVSQVKCHNDSLYDAKLSPDGQILATCSYDRQIQLWDAATGAPLRTLSGHNGAVFELAFSSDGTLLASASADDTVKIWRVADGERLDTLGQPEGTQSTVAFSPNDRWILAGGEDRKLRMWKLVSRERPEINPLLFSRTAHNSPITKLAISPDGKHVVTSSEGRDLRLWEAGSLTPLHDFEQQPDVVTGIAFVPSGGVFYVSRIDGSWQRYDVQNVATVASTAPSSVPPAEHTPAKAPIQRFDGGEQEPNDDLSLANPISSDAIVRGVITAPTEANQGVADIDFYRFRATKGQQLILEINAARQKSPLDSQLQVLDAAGKPVPRVLLQAVRETYFTFRGHNSTDLNDYRLHGWEDMELNEFLYANGEVNRLWLYPRGPDSGFIVYPGFSGQRHSFFGTSPIAHALNEPSYIVEPHSPGTQLIPNGLPQFTVYYENDDDGWRKLGNDSRIAFMAPADGEYMARVTDVRGQGGDDYKYELIIREPKPDFTVRMEAPDLTINAGSGKEFTLVADRADEFDGDIRIEISDLPPGFHASTPIMIQAGQNTAFGIITADENAPAPTAENSKLAKVRAVATIDGKERVKEPLPLGEIKLAERPKIRIRILAADNGETAVPAPSDKDADNDGMVELVVEPGKTITATLQVERNGYDGEVSFGNEYAGRNLPHGVYIDNIGLNGMTLLQGETQRTFFITAANWVPETTRLFHVRANQEGNQTSLPVRLHVRKSRQ